MGTPKEKHVKPRLVPRPVHPFPARMAAAIPWEELSGSGKPLRVLDPMSGSGTTLAVARALGHQAIGFDTDPLAVLIARAWCETLMPDRLLRSAERVLHRAEVRATAMPDRDAYPPQSDDETRRFIRYWFDRPNRRQLTSLAAEIKRVPERETRTLLWCAFSRLIIAKQAGASRALDLAHSRPHRVADKVTVVRPFSSFVAEVKRLCASAPFASEHASALPEASVCVGDARMLPVENESVDVVITSPPYLNAIDYQRTTKFSLVWMGYQVSDLRVVRAGNIGTEAGGRDRELTDVQRLALRALGRTGVLPPRILRMLARYIEDMEKALNEIARVLVRGGRALLVVGDSTIRGTYVRNSKALLVLANACGLQVATIRRRRLPPNRRYLPPPRETRKGLHGRLRTEALLYLHKAA